MELSGFPETLYLMQTVNAIWVKSHEQLLHLSMKEKKIIVI